MDHFNYKNGELYAEDVPVSTLIEQVGTPFYCYSTATLLRHYHVFRDSFDGMNLNVSMCYSVKSNSNLAVIKTLANAGSGGDCVSEGEIRRCLAAGIPADKLIFAGVGKTKAEMAYALKQGIMQFNVESIPELDALNEVATSLNLKAPVAFRMNPNVEAGTHDKISTGRKEDKFGIEWERASEVYAKAAALSHIHVQGIAVHIGSQLSSLEPFERAFTKVAELTESLRSQGHVISHLDLGGGLGIPYDESCPPPLPADYAKVVQKTVGHLGCALAFEPGRLISGNSGILVSSVILLKKTAHKNFLIIDAAMNDLIRPSLYDARHQIIPVKETDQPTLSVDIVGPVCESGDVFVKNLDFPSLSDGDAVAIRSSGAYGAVMSGTYNTRPLIPEILVNGQQFEVVRPRQSYEDLLGLDVMPNWL